MESSSRGILPRVLAIEDAARRVSNNGYGTTDEWTTELMDAARSGPLPIHDYLNDEAEPYTSSTVKTTDVQKYFVERHGVDLLTVKAVADAAPIKGGASGESNMATDWQSRRDGFDHRRDKPTDRPINWKYWGSLPALKQWEACALSVNVNPENLKAKRMVMPGMPVFLPESFPSRTVELEFDRRLTMINRYGGGNHLAVVYPQWFAGWCLHVGLENLPPELVAMTATEPPAAPVVTPEPTAAPVVAEGASGGTGKVWTPERIAEARAFRAKHGLKKTAEHYSVSQATISKHLPAKEAKPAGFSAFTYRNK